MRKLSAKEDPSLTSSGRASNAVTTTSAILFRTVSVRRPTYFKKWPLVAATTTHQEHPSWKFQSTMPRMPRMIKASVFSGRTYQAWLWISSMGRECFWTRAISTWLRIRWRKTVAHLHSIREDRTHWTGPPTMGVSLRAPAPRASLSMARCVRVKIAVASLRSLSAHRQKGQHLTRKTPSTLVKEQGYK